MEEQDKMSFLKRNDRTFINKIMATGGYFLLSVSAGIILLLGVKYYSSQSGEMSLLPDQSCVSFLVHYYSREFILLIGAIISGTFALRLLFGAYPNTVEVIPQKDRDLLEPLIRESNKEAINQYVILSSLSGFTGTFQKIGFSGLPLATVTLTLIFSFLSFFRAEFMDLAKLTLGAFIGSFVQKGQDQLKMAKQINEMKS